MAEKNPAKTRLKLLQAAADYVIEQRIIDLTLDQIAATAGVSKGGLLHHFPTKLDLLKGLTGYLCDLFVSRFVRIATASDHTQRGWWARAYIHTTFDAPPKEMQLMGALIAAIASYPEVYEMYRQHFSTLDQADDDQLPAQRRLMIRLACDGFALAEMSGSPPIPPDERQELFDYLMELTNE